MAEMNLPAKGGRRKVQAPRIDLTPMVDLGFLLITFFMFTTVLAQPKSLELTMPAKDGIIDTPTAFPEESTLTLMPGGGHKLYYYEGILDNARKVRCVTMNSILNVVVEKQKRVRALPTSFSAQAHKLHVLIKASDDSRYDDLVKTIDAMLIANVPHYAIVDITAEEQEAINAAAKP